MVQSKVNMFHLVATKKFRVGRKKEGRKEGVQERERERERDKGKKEVSFFSMWKLTGNPPSSFVFKFPVRWNHRTLIPKGDCYPIDELVHGIWSLPTWAGSRDQGRPALLRAVLVCFWVSPPGGAASLLGPLSLQFGDRHTSGLGMNKYPGGLKDGCSVHTVL